MAQTLEGADYIPPTHPCDRSSRPSYSWPRRWKANFWMTSRFLKQICARHNFEVKIDTTPPPLAALAERAGNLRLVRRRSAAKTVACVGRLRLQSRVPAALESAQTSPGLDAPS